MRRIISILLLLLGLYNAEAQKPLIDLHAMGEWPKVGSPKISNDGAYALFTIYNKPVGNNTLVIKSTIGKWEKIIPGAVSNNSVITEDNKLAIFMQSSDTLSIVTLGTQDIEYILNISSYKEVMSNGNPWVAYLMKNLNRELTVRNLVSGTQKIFQGVIDYVFSDNGEELLLQTEKIRNKLSTHLLQWVNLKTGNSIIIWEGSKASNYTVDSKNTQIAFIADTLNDNNNQPHYMIWHWKDGMDKAKILINEKSPGIDNEFRVSNESSIRFSNDGNRIFFKLKQAVNDIPPTGAVKIDIWSYKDAHLQSQQLNELKPRYFEAIADIRRHKVVQLERENEHVFSYFPGKETDDFVLIKHIDGDDKEWNWNINARSSIYLISTTNGERITISENLKEWMPYYTLSPEGKYVVYYDNKARAYFSYNVVTKTFRNITHGIKVSWTREGFDRPSPAPPIGVASWVEHDSAVLVYDQYDIWQLDPKGILQPINITSGYGRVHRTEFLLSNPNTLSIQKDSILMLVAFNSENMYNGFYKLQMGCKKGLFKLTMGPYLYYWPSISYFRPLKARDTAIYIVSRMNSMESTNFFLTRDFIIYAPLSNVAPEKKYNWMTSELVKLKNKDGSLSKGILYKPENFDPQKKYPVILYCYEILSSRLNEYHEASTSTGPMNIPFFVSNNYLVFAFDIHYNIGEPGKSSYQATLPAIRYLSKLPFIDMKKVGIQGHSWGGYEVNYLVTHTHLFAAAASASGNSDFISGYGSISFNGVGAQFFYETSQSRISASLWERPDRYIKNSPVFKANNVTTPLLLMNNKGDAVVPFSQGVEFFTALRRLGKKVWMLQYDDGGHEVYGKSAEDYSIRLFQFFEHYLKGSPAPRWMTAGIKASKKGIDTGLELDYNNRP